MLVYQTLDIFDEKQKLKGVSRPQNSTSSSSGSSTETTYLGKFINTNNIGLMIETFIS